MRFISLLCLYTCIGFAALSHAQTNQLLTKARQTAYSNPGQAIKIGDHLLKTADTNGDKAQAAMLLAESHFAKGETDQALTFAFTTLEYAKAADDKMAQANALGFISGMLRMLLLDMQSTYYLEESKKLISELSQNDCLELQAKLSVAEARQNLSIHKPEKALTCIKKAISDFGKTTGPERDYLIHNARIVEGKCLMALGKNDKAEAAFTEVLTYFSHKKPNNLFELSVARNELGKLYFQQKQHQRAADTLILALTSASVLGNVGLQKESSRLLAVNSLARNDRNGYNVYNQKFLAFSDKTDDDENEATNQAFNLVGKEQEIHNQSQLQLYTRMLYIAGAAFLLVLLPGIVVFIRNRNKQQRYTEIIRYLELNKNNVLPAVKKEPTKSLVIPAETEQVLLTKLKKFEASTRFTNKEMSLAMLAAQLDTNTKYLSEIINRNHHDNFNTYINKLRIAYIIDKMNNNPSYLNYKISYLAEESGFSSHSSFATIFKAITGIAPTTFIDFRKEEVSKTKKADA